MPKMQNRNGRRPDELAVKARSGSLTGEVRLNAVRAMIGLCLVKMVFGARLGTILMIPD